MPLKIERMFAFVAVDENGDEGVVAEWMPTSGPDGKGSWMPYVGADLEKVGYLRVRADSMVEEFKKRGKVWTYKVLEFDLKGELG